MLCYVGLGNVGGAGQNCAWAEETVSTYLALYISDQQTLENLSRFIAVSNVFEGLRRILASDI
jgi:hypothetical protein